MIRVPSCTKQPRLSQGAWIFWIFCCHKLSFESEGFWEARRSHESRTRDRVPPIVSQCALPVSWRRSKQNLEKMKPSAALEHEVSTTKTRLYRNTSFYKNRNMHMCLYKSILYSVNAIYSLFVISICFTYLWNMMQIVSTRSNWNCTSLTSWKFRSFQLEVPSWCNLGSQGGRQRHGRDGEHRPSRPSSQDGDLWRRRSQGYAEGGVGP